MSGGKGGPYGNGSKGGIAMTGAEMSRMTIESQGDLIDKLSDEVVQLRSELATTKSELATAKAATAAAEAATVAAEAATAAKTAEAAEWCRRFSELLDDTKVRVRQHIDWIAQMRAEPEVSDTTPSGH